MPKATVFKFLIYFFALYPLFAFVAYKLTGLAPGNITGLMMIILLFIMLSKVKSIVFRRYFLFYILFFIYVIVLNSIKINSDISIFKFFYSNSSVKFLIFLIFIQWEIKKIRVNLKFIHRLLVFIIIFSVIVIIIQQFLPIFFISPDYIKAWMETEGGSLVQAEELRSPSIYSWVGSMGVGMIFIPFISVVVNNYLINNKNRLAYLFLFLGLLVAILSKGRWMMINAVLLFAMIFHYSKVRFGRIVKIVLIAFLALIGVYYLMPTIGVNVNNLIAERILETNMGGLSEGSASSRIIAFEVFFKLFPKEPVFGVGGQITNDLMRELAGRSSQLHVGYLSLFYYYGILGGLLYLVFIFYLTKSLFRNAKVHGYYSPLYSWIGFLIANLTLNYIIPFEAGILLVLLLDKYYLLACRENISKLSFKSMSQCNKRNELQYLSNKKWVKYAQ